MLQLYLILGIERNAMDVDEEVQEYHFSPFAIQLCSNSPESHSVKKVNKGRIILISYQVSDLKLYTGLNGRSSVYNSIWSKHL